MLQWLYSSGWAREGPGLPRDDELLALLPALDAAAAQLLGIAAAAPPARTADLKRARRLLAARSEGALPHTHFLQILRTKPLLEALVRLTVAAATAAAGGLLEGSGAGSAGGSASGPSGDPPTSRTQLDVGLAAAKLLHQAAAHTLEHAAELWQLLHDAGRPLLAVRVLHRAARCAAEVAACVRSKRAAPHRLSALSAPLELCVWLVGVLALPACVPAPGLANCGPGAAQRCQRLRREVVEALASSRVLEHAAQGMVLLAGLPGTPAAALEALRHAVSCLHRLRELATSAHLAARSAGDAGAEEQLLRALQPAGVQHLGVAVGLVRLCALDAGPAYGLDEQLYVKLLPRGDTLPLRDDTTSLYALLDALGPHAPRQYLHRHHAVHLLLRVASATVPCVEHAARLADARAAAAGAARGSVPLRPSDWVSTSPQQPLGLECATQLTNNSLIYVSELLGHSFSNRGPLPATATRGSGSARPGAVEVAEQEEEEEDEQEGVWLELRRIDTWRLRLRYMWALLSFGVTRKLHNTRSQIVDCLSNVPLVRAGGLPSRPLQAAVCAHLLPWLERLLRTAAQSGADSAHSAVAVDLLAKCPLFSLLNLDMPTHAASLLLTLCKLVRRGWLSVPTQSTSMSQVVAAFLLVSACSVPKAVAAEVAAAVESGRSSPRAPGAMSLAGAQPPPPPPQQQQQQQQQSEQDRAPLMGSVPSPVLSLLLHDLLPAVADGLVASEASAAAAGAACSEGDVASWRAVLGWTAHLCALSAAATASPPLPCSGAAYLGGQPTEGTSSGDAASGSGSHQAAGGSGSSGVGGPVSGVVVEGGGASGGGSSAAAAASSGALEGSGAVGSGGAASGDEGPVEEVLRRLGAVRVVAGALRFMLRVLRASSWRSTTRVMGREEQEAWLAAVLTVARSRPRELHGAVRGESDQATAGAGSGGGVQAGGGAGASSSSSSSSSRGGGEGSGAQVWPLRELLKALPRGAPRRAELEHLAQQLKVWSTSGSTEAEVVAPGGSGADAACCPAALPLPFLVSYAQAHALLRTCSNPSCVELQGDSESEQAGKLLRCAGCEVAWYCCKGCQAAHWRAGHKAACSKGRGSG